MNAVREIARRLHARLPRHVELSELESAGLLGLLDAASKFDLSRAVQFRSYAQFRIQGAMLDSLRSLDWSPRELRRKGRELHEIRQTLSVRLCRLPSETEMAEALGLSLPLFQQLTCQISTTELVNLDAEQGEDGTESLAKLVPASPQTCPLRRCLERESREQLTAAIEALPERERLVLTLSYFEELTLKEIGMILNVVESRVCQIRSSALARLKRQLKHRPIPSAAAL